MIYDCIADHQRHTKPGLKSRHTRRNSTTPMRANFKRYVDQITQNVNASKYLESLNWDHSYRSVKIEKSRPVCLDL